MALSKSLKRKVDSENRAYKEEWKDNYAFILPSFANAKPVCLICNEVVAVCKEYNIRRHHEAKHGSFKVAFPLQTEARKRKIEALTASYAHSSTNSSLITGACAMRTSYAIRQNGLHL